MNKREWVVVYVMDSVIREDIVVADNLRKIADYLLVTGRPIEDCDIISIVENSSIGATAMEISKDKIDYGVVTVDAVSSTVAKSKIGVKYTDDE